MTAEREPPANGSDSRLAILGIPVDVTDARSVRQSLRASLANASGNHCAHIVTLNPEYVMAARQMPEFAAAIADADLITADGIGVVLAARLLYPRVGARIERVTGVEIVEWLAEESGPAEAPLFLLGAGPGVAAAAADALTRRFPSARIAGWWSDGTPNQADDQASLNRIAESGARAVAVAYGAPAQVVWIQRNREQLARLGVRVAIGVGGALDFIAGAAPRAPRWLRSLGLEWLYRLVRQPWRWRRQMALPLFSFHVLRDWLARLWRRGNRPQKYARSQ